jgi:hypothetical protein
MGQPVRAPVTSHKLSSCALAEQRDCLRGLCNLRFEQLVQNILRARSRFRIVELPSTCSPCCAQQFNLEDPLLFVVHNSFQQCWKCVTIRSIVPASNRSVLYSHLPSMPFPVSANCTVISNFAVPLSVSSGCRLDSLQLQISQRVFCKTSITWNKGVRLRSRSACSSDTSRSKRHNSLMRVGADGHRLAHARSNSRKVGFPERSVRMTTC